MVSVQDKGIYYGLSLSGNNLLIESTERLLDFDESPTKFYKGTYKTDSVEHSCLFTKSNGRINDLGWQCSSIKKIKHTNAITLFNVVEDAQSPRFIYGPVHGTLKKWISAESPWSGLFIGEDNKWPSRRFHNIIVGICGVIQYLFSEGLAPASIGFDDLYVIMSSNEPIVQVHITKVELLKPGVMKVQHENEVWLQVKEIVKEISVVCNVELDHILQKYCDFIGKRGFLNKLENYPFNWDYEEKVDLLYGITSADRTEMRTLINSTDIKWPVWSVLDKIYLGDKEEAFEYINLIRNVCKHFDTYPLEVQDELRSPPEFIKMAEEHTPDIWIKLYEKTGKL